MKWFWQLWRLIHINYVFLRHGLDEFIFVLKWFRPLKFFYHLAPWNWFRKHRSSRAERVRFALEDLGPIFIKFGQMLSTRRDLLPPDYAVELAKLQDDVPPFSGEQSKAIVEKALGKSVEEVFAKFETEPMASASVAQVHAATLKNGRNVVVKVLRPGIEKTIHRDIELMYILARLAERYWSEGKRLRPVDVIAEYEKTIFDELDLQRESANASQLRRNFEDSDLLYVPQVFWDYTSKNVMVMERIYGTPIGNMDLLRREQVDFKVLSERGVEVFFTQVFRDNFFHADMHPGNIFVDTKDPQQPKYIAVDFGIIGSLTDSDQRYLAENFYAFFRRDYRRVAELHIESGWVPTDTRVEEFESAIRTVCEPIFERPLKEISFGHFLLRLFQTARRFNMEVQPQLVLLQKTLLNIEGLGRDLYPDLDLWKTAKPYIESWMKEQMGVTGMIKGMRMHLPKLLEKLPETPLLLHEVIQQAAQGKLQIREKSEEITDLIETLQTGQKKTALWIVGGTLLVGAAVLVNESIPPYWLGASWLFWLSLGGGLVAWLSALKKNIR